MRTPRTARRHVAFTTALMCLLATGSLAVTSRPANAADSTCKDVLVLGLDGSGVVGEGLQEPVSTVAGGIEKPARIGRCLGARR